MSQYGGNNPYSQPGQGEAASYYTAPGGPPNGQEYPPQQYPPQQYPQHGQQYNPQQYPQQGYQPDGPDGERGVMGAIGGGLAGGVGGHALGGKANHSKLGTVLGVVGGAFAGHKLQDGISSWKDNRHSSSSSPNQEKPSDGSLTPHGVAYAGNFSSSSRDIRLDSSSGGGNYTLHAACQRPDGSFQASSIDLNKVLSNDQGSFRWVAPPGSDRKHAGDAQRQREVTVQQGDTLRGIARQVGVEFEEIARANGLQNADLIYPGQVLQIPGGGSHGVGFGGGGGGESVGNFGLSARNVRVIDGGRRLEGELLRDGQWLGSSIVLDERIGNENGTLTYKA